MVCNPFQLNCHQYRAVLNKKQNKSVGQAQERDPLLCAAPAGPQAGGGGLHLRLVRRAGLGRRPPCGTVARGAAQGRHDPRPALLRPEGHRRRGGLPLEKRRRVSQGRSAKCGVRNEYVKPSHS